MVFPDFQPMRVSEELVCIYLFWQNPVFTSLHLRSPVRVVPPLISPMLSDPNLLAKTGFDRLRRDQSYFRLLALIFWPNLSTCTKILALDNNELEHQLYRLLDLI
jgi:hypothetical protein